LEDLLRNTMSITSYIMKSITILEKL